MLEAVKPVLLEKVDIISLLRFTNWAIRLFCTRTQHRHNSCHTPPRRLSYTTQLLLYLSLYIVSTSMIIVRVPYIVNR